MLLKNLSMINFKNIAQADLAFSGKLNCFVGDNGAGKTNVLDAIHFLSMCKSAFNLTDGQSVNHAADFFVVEGQYTLDGDRREAVACSFKKGGGKAFKRNGKEYEKLSEHIGLLPVVLVSPSDTMLIHESGEERRRFLNTLLSQIDREYLGALIRYNRLLAERNKLLKNPGGQRFSGLLEVLDLQLVPAGEAVHARRRAVVEELRPAVERYYAILSDDREQVEISYKSELNDTPFADLLLQNAERDRVMQHTTGGIHRDDIRFSIGGHLLRKFGSQGQQKSFLVALKLAHFDVIAQKCGYKPILLLDDVFDKLDLARVERLIRLVSEGRFGQIFVTDSNKVRLDLILKDISDEYFVFQVNEGIITKAE